MAHFIAVQVQFPRITYVPLIALGHRSSSRRALVPIRDGQRTAVVRLFLMQGDPSDRGSTPLRELHAFRLSGLDRVAAGRPRLALTAHFDGRRTVSARIEVEGDGVQAARFSVPRSRRRVAASAISVLILLLLGGAALFFLRGWSSGGERRDGPPAVPSGSTYGTEREDRESSRTTERVGEDPERSAPAEPTSDGTDQDAPPTGEDSGVVAPESSDPGPVLIDQPEPMTPLPALPLNRVVYFEPNRTYLTGAAREELDALLPVLLDHPELALTLEGHTALFGTEEGRAEISRGRAEGVLAYFLERGWSPETPPEVLWRGSREPVTRDRREQHLNRRVEIGLTRRD